MADDNTPDFGNKGKITIRASRGNIRVNDGQHLHYFVTAEGARPIFSLSCTHKTHWDASTLGPPKKNYDVVWPRSAADERPEQDGESYTFSMSFTAALKYTLRVELHDAGHNLLANGLVKDADYESDDSTDSYHEAFKVRTKPQE